MGRSRPVRSGALLFALSLISARSLAAQDLPVDRPAVLPAVKLSKADSDHVEAVVLFGLGNLHEGQHHLLEAMRCYEAACKLEPDAASVWRALVPLYLALDRIEDALAAGARALQIDPDDWETGTLQARQLRAVGKPGEAAATLRRAAASSHAKEKPPALAQMLADLAYLDEEAGNWKQAVASLRELAELLDHPAPLIELGTLTAEEASSKSAEAYEGIGRLLLKAGDSPKAVAAFETARKRDPGRANRLALHLAEIYDRAGQPRLALAHLDEYLAGCPSGIEAYESKIRLLKQIGEVDRIVPALQSASASDPHNTALALLLARELRRAERMAEAEVVYNRLVQDVPGPDVFRGLFGLYKERGAAGGERALLLLDKTIREAGVSQKRVSSGNARSDLADNQAANGRAMLLALRDDPESVKLLVKSARGAIAVNSPLDDATLRLLGGLAERVRLFEIAEELYRCVLGRGKLTPDEEHDVYAGLLAVLQRQHKNEAVIALCKQGLAKGQESQETIFYLDLSLAHQALAQYDEALAAATKAIEHANPAARLICQRNRVEVLSKAGRHAEAIAECQAMLREYNQAQKISSGPDGQGARVRDVRLELSQAYGAAGEHEKSDEQLQLILEADPEDDTANNNLGFQWSERGVHLDEAERMIRKAIDLSHRHRGAATTIAAENDEENAAYVDSLGWVLYRKGKLKEARTELEKATTLQGGEDDPIVWDHLGDVRFHQVDKAKAAEAWKKALELFETGRRLKDDRYREIQQKLRQVAP